MPDCCIDGTHIVKLLVQDMGTPQKLSGYTTLKKQSRIGFLYNSSDNYVHVYVTHWKQDQERKLRKENSRFWIWKYHPMLSF